MTSLLVRYLEINLIVVVGAVALGLLALLAEKGSRRIRYSTQLWVARWILLAAIALPFFSGFFPDQNFVTPSAQIWDSSTMKGEFTANASRPVMTLASDQSAFSTEALGPVIWIAILAMLGAAIVRFGQGVFQLRKICDGSIAIRRIGSAEIRVSEEFSIPFSFWTPKTAYVFLPQDLIHDRSDYAIALRHEVQHHRQRDTVWSYLTELFQCFFILNPFAHFLVKRIHEIQEFACDEALVVRRCVSPHAYGSCLLRVAETARGAHSMLVGTTSMSASSAGPILKRRIHHMLETNTKRYLDTKVSLALGALTIVAMATTAWASQGIVEDRRVTMQEATELARKISGFPITINEAVLKQLNRFVGTPDGREFMRSSLARMENYKPLIERKLAQYGLPIELMAMPIMESGYKNTPENKYPQYSSGLWQFTRGTGIKFGMKVTEDIDERTDVEKATDGACQYLAKLHSMFNDWELAIMGYNSGENQIKRGIKATGSKNAWTLIENGYQGDPNYLPKMVAAILIMQSPNLVN